MAFTFGAVKMEETLPDTDPVSSTVLDTRVIRKAAAVGGHLGEAICLVGEPGVEFGNRVRNHIPVE